ncbi:MAG: hypothetical protein HKN50_04565 [Gammaproteobacteria bacterium]|nr:hypothetical protein [Gammaproteobacteria bacterium]
MLSIAQLRKILVCLFLSVAVIGLATAQQDDSLLADDDLLLDDGDLLAEDDDLLSDDDDLLSDDLLDDDLLSEDDLYDEDDEADSEAAPDEVGQAHLDLFAEDRYPSANACKACHPKHYDEWSVSQHSYAQLSPVYMAFQNSINSLTSNTNGDFCIRCHNQVGMNIGESTFISNLDRHPTSREGITCVVCHRIDQNYGKVSGRMALREGDLLSPIYGPKGDGELKRVLDNRDKYRVVTDPERSGRKIHTEVGHFPQLSSSSFCGTCHDVNLFNGFRLEEAFSEYKNSPAAAAGTSCQDCHMGTTQGVPDGYEIGPAAMVGGVPTEDRKLTNHFFAGPDHSVIHPGIFPHNAEAAAMATLADWLQFDHAAGWGTDAFEDSVSEDYEFPPRWRSIDDRYDARAIMERQFNLLEWAKTKRLEVLQNGYLLEDVQLISASKSRGVHFTVDVKNGTDGHNVPTGFDAERLIWLKIDVTDANGNVVFYSGDLDPNGDLRDTHSLYVHDGLLPLDKQLFTLQSRFITRLVRGGEREQVLAINTSPDPLPFVRPFTRSLTLTGQPAGARKHRQTIPPLATRVANYKIPADRLTGPGPYTADIKLMSAMVPVNLIDAIQYVGFDYGMSARQIADQIVAGHTVIWEKTLSIPMGAAAVAGAPEEDKTAGD